MKCAKYIMEYLFLEFGVIVCNEGYSIRDMNDTGVQNNIMDIKEEYMCDIVLIYHIVLYSDDINADKISVSTEGRLEKHFLSWAKKTSLTGQVKIICAIKEDLISTYDYNVLHIEKEKDIIALTPEREERYYERYYNNYIKSQHTADPTIISISRTSDGKLELTNNVLNGNFKNRGELLFRLKKEFITDEVDESIILTYNKSYIPERLVYEKESDFYAAFYYKNGILSRKRQGNAFKCFHVLYIEMLAQQGIDYEEVINSDLFDSNGGDDEW